MPLRIVKSEDPDLQGRGRLKLVTPGELVRRTLELLPVDRLENVEIIDDQHA